MVTRLQSPLKAAFATLGSLSIALAILLGSAPPASAASANPTSAEGAGFSLGLLPDTPATLAHVPSHNRLSVAAALPASVDLTSGLPPVGDQGAEGSCVAWSTGYYYASFQEGKERNWDLKDPAHQFSPAWLYNQINGGVDRGAYPSAAFNLMQSSGIASLRAMPYTAGDYRTQPTALQKQDALPYTVSSFATFAPNDITGMKAHLAGGDLVSLSIPVYGNFFYPPNPCTTPIGAPTAGDYSRGGHQITLVGYDDAKQAFHIANSWNTWWGCNGFAWLTYDFVARYAWMGYDMVGKTDTLGILSGQVTDSTTHAALAGAQVSVGGYTITSDSTGAFALAVPAGAQTISVRAAGYTTASQTAQLSAGNVTTLNPTLRVVPTQGVISGKVTDSSTRAAIAGATVTAGSVTATTNSAGVYSLTVTAGAQTVSVAASGYTSTTQSLQVAANATATFNASLVAVPATLTGKVTDAATKAPIANAVVTVGDKRTVTTTTGVYSLVVPAGSTLVTITATGYAGLGQTVQANSGTTVTLNVSLARLPALISGRVTDAVSKAAVVGARVTVGGVSATTNASGTYTLVVPAGTVTIGVTGTGYITWTQAANASPGGSLTVNPTLTRAPASPKR